VTWRRLARHPLGRLGSALLAALAVLALGAPWLAPYEPAAPSGRPFEPPGPAHLLGTDDVGQDILSELIVGTRVSLLIGTLAAGVAVVIGTGVGVVAGFLRGPADAALMRLTDVVLVMPFLPLLVLLAAYLGHSLGTLIAVIGLLFWARPARVIRAQARSLAEREYVLAARALGAGDARIIGRHILPGVLSLAAAQFVLAVSAAILLEAALSFLGLGDPTAKSWGTLLFYAQARNAFLGGTWLWWVIPPGLLIAAASLGFALVGLALEEALDPRLRGRRGGGGPASPGGRPGAAATGP